MTRGRSRRPAFTGLAAVVYMGGMAGTASAQSARLAPGDILYNGGDQQVKVIECRPLRLGGRECETVGWEDGQAISNPAWWNEKMLLDGDARVRRQLGLPARDGGTPAPAAAPPASAAVAPVRGTPAPTLATAPATKAGGKAADGRYTCQMWMRNSYVDLGAVQLAGGRLNPDPVAKTGGTVTGITAAPGGITINYMTARGYRESMDCKRG